MNSEAYEELQLSGDIQALESTGIQFLNGDFSHEESLELGKNTFKNMNGNNSVSNCSMSEK